MTFPTSLFHQLQQIHTPTHSTLPNSRDCKSGLSLFKSPHIRTPASLGFLLSGFRYFRLSFTWPATKSDIPFLPPSNLRSLKLNFVIKNVYSSRLCISPDLRTSVLSKMGHVKLLTSCYQWFLSISEFEYALLDTLVSTWQINTNNLTPGDADI